jgi:hypothetical protein
MGLSKQGLKIVETSISCSYPASFALSLRPENNKTAGRLRMKD